MVNLFFDSAFFSNEEIIIMEFAERLKVAMFDILLSIHIKIFSVRGFLFSKWRSTKKRVYETAFRLFFLLIFTSFFQPAFATTYYSRQSGDWNNNTTWSTVGCGGAAAATFPGSSDDVYICSGHTVTVTADANARTLDVTGIIVVNDAVTLTIEGNCTIQASGSLYLSGNTTCTGNNQSTLVVKGNYSNYGYSCFWKSWAIIAGDLYSPSASGIQNNGYLIIGGNAIGTINQTGGSSVYPINPYAVITLSGTTPITTPPASPAGLVTIINNVINGGSSCGFTINGPANANSCSGGPADFTITSTTATAPVQYKWEENQGFGWVPKDDAGIYSGTTTSVLHISNTTGMNGYIYRCKVTDASSCPKYSYAGTLTVNTSLAVPTVGAITQPTCALATGSVVLSGLPAGNWTINPGAINGNTASTTISGLATGTYNFTVTSAVSGCTSAATANVVINAQPVTPAVPTVGAITQPTCALATGSVVLSGLPAGNWTINPGAINGNTASTTISGLATGTYNFSVTSAVSGCTSAATANVVINAQPSAPAQATFTIVQPTCAVATAAITITGPLGAYEYNIDGGAYQAGLTFNNVAAGAHAILVRSTTDNTCVSTSSTATVNAQPVAPAVPTVASTTQPTCSLTTGTIVFTAQAGVEYSVGSGYQAGATFAGLAPGAYTLSVRSIADNTCETFAASTVSINAAPATPAVPTVSSTTQPTCSVTTGTVVFTAQAGVEYSVGTGYQAGATFAGLAAGTYTLSVRSIADNTCETFGASTVAISAAPAAPAVPTVASTTQPTCSVATGTIVFTAQAGIEYSIGSGYQAGVTFAGLAPGTYTLSVRSIADNTCETFAASTVTINAAPAAPAVPTVASTTQPTCSVTTGTIVFTAQAGVEYSVGSGYQAGATFAGLAAGTYTLSVRSIADNTCETFAASTVTINAAPAAPAVPTVGTITQPTCTVATGSVVLSGLPAGNWTIDPGAITGSTTSTTVSGLIPGTYSFTVSDASGCSSAATVNVVINTQPSAPAQATFTITQPTCTAATGTITITAPVGAYEYNINGGVFQSGVTFNNLVSGTYAILVRSSSDNTCVSVSATATINAQPVTPPAPTIGSVTQPTCAISTGSVVLNGLPAGNWTINPGGITGNTTTTTISALTAGSYDFTVSDGSGCTSAPATSVVINAQPVTPAVPTVGTIVQPSCSVSTGSVVLSGLPAGNWSINPGAISGNTASTTLSSLATGTYSFTVTSVSSGCTSSPTANVVINSQPITPSSPVVGTITQPTCAAATGSVVLSGLPAGNWTINPGAINGNTASTTILSLTAGTYSFTVTSSGCSSAPAANVVITAPSSTLNLTIDAQTNITCNGSGNGVISASASGGTSPYTYKLGTGAFQNTGTFSSLTPGTYVVTVRDAVQCETSKNVTINEPAALALPYTSEPSSCPDYADAKITLSPAGGTPPYRILWSDGSASNNRTNLLAGTYDVVLSDANNCSAAFKVVIEHSTDGGCLQIQEIITPNNDGFYDTWKIRNIDMYPDAEIQVFNRWGEKVFSTKNLSANPWDGTYNGKPLPTDSYHYIINLEKGVKPLSGTISIIR